MIERSELTVELVGSLVEVLLGLYDVKTTVLEGSDCVFLGVGVEVAGKEGRELGPLFLLTEVLQQRFCLLLSDLGVVALAIASIIIALYDGPLRFKVVRYCDEVLVVVVADGVKLLGQRLACRAGEGLVIKDDGLAHRLHLFWLVDESYADDVLISAQLLGGLNKIPLARLLVVECVNKTLQCFIAPRLITCLLYTSDAADE